MRSAECYSITPKMFGWIYQKFGGLWALLNIWLSQPNFATK